MANTRQIIWKTLLDHYRINLVVFPSAGPETYCYTLTEAWMAGRPALVPPIGALYERVQDERCRLDHAKTGVILMLF
jgi:glycosyltransferase involved in cell wall biosynthesis